MSIWGVIPAAGIGSRMNSEIPKQYLIINGRTVLDHSIARLLASPQVSGVCVALSVDDRHWLASEYATHSKVVTVAGGAERHHSVRNALEALDSLGVGDAWVLVHDAARPCLSDEDLSALISQVDDENGGLLACPVVDTLKKSDARSCVLETVDRQVLWRAMTPQMFRLQALKKAIDQAVINGLPITDDAGAMELSGVRPKLIEGSARNIKITRPEDLWMAEMILMRQER